MVQLVKILATAANSLGQLIPKFLRYGKDDVQTALQSAPYGVDSNPVKGMVAVYAPTTNNGRKVIIGYINQSLAAVGETRLFSTDADGALKFYTWLKNDGTLELGGATNNLVKFTALSTALNNQDTLINAELAKIASALALVGGSYLPGTVTTDISNSKINEIKTI